MRAAWASFAASGNPSTADVAWPSFNDAGHGLSLVPPQPQVDTELRVPPPLRVLGRRLIPSCCQEKKSAPEHCSPQQRGASFHSGNSGLRNDQPKAPPGHGLVDAGAVPLDPRQLGSRGAVSPRSDIQHSSGGRMLSGSVRSGNIISMNERA